MDCRAISKKYFDNSIWSENCGLNLKKVISEVFRSGFRLEYHSISRQFFPKIDPNMGYILTCHIPNKLTTATNINCHMTIIIFPMQSWTNPRWRLAWQRYRSRKKLRTMATQNDPSATNMVLKEERFVNNHGSMLHEISILLHLQKCSMFP